MAVVGQFHSSVTEAVQDLAEQLKVPVFLTQASAKKLTEKHLTYTFRTHVIDPDRVTLWNKWIQQQGFKRVALLAENTDYGVGLVEETKKQFASMGVKAELKTHHLRPGGRRPDAPAPRDQELEAGPAHQHRASGTPMYLISKQAFDVGLMPATPMLISYDAPARAGVLEEPGEKGTYARLHHLLPPDDEADAAGPGLPLRATSSSSRRSRS